MSSYDEEVVAAAAGAGTSIAVTGEGALADRLRARLSAASPAAGADPDVIVVASGRGSDVADALGRVADLGTVVVAGPPVEPTLAIDLYTHLHARGITLIGLMSAPGRG